MADVRYYTDEHVVKAVAIGLRLRGVDVLTVPEAGLLGASDEEQLAFAFSEVRVIVTQDVDFLRLAALGMPHAGLVYAPQTTSVGQLVRTLMSIHSVMAAEDMVGVLEFI